MKATLYVCLLNEIMSPMPGVCIECGAPLEPAEFVWSKLADEWLREKDADIKRLRDALSDAVEFFERAPFDFRNGNESNGTDEGEYYGVKAMLELDAKMRGALEGGPK